MIEEVIATAPTTEPYPKTLENILSMDQYIKYNKKIKADAIPNDPINRIWNILDLDKLSPYKTNKEPSNIFPTYFGIKTKKFWRISRRTSTKSNKNNEDEVETSLSNNDDDDEEESPLVEPIAKLNENHIDPGSCFKEFVKKIRLSLI